MKIKNFKFSMLLMACILQGCATRHEEPKPEIKKEVQIRKPEENARSSFNAIEARVRNDLKLIGKTDQEIEAYMIEWRKDAKAQIR